MGLIFQYGFVLNDSLSWNNDSNFANTHIDQEMIILAKGAFIGLWDKREDTHEWDCNDNKETFSKGQQEPNIMC